MTSQQEELSPAGLEALFQASHDVIAVADVSDGYEDYDLGTWYAADEAFDVVDAAADRPFTAAVRFHPPDPGLPARYEVQVRGATGDTMAECYGALPVDRDAFEAAVAALAR